MNARTTTTIVILSTALVAAAWFMVQGRGAVPERGRGEPVLPDLEAKAAQVGAVEVLRGNSTMQLERTPDGWVLASNDGYPARTELVRALVASLAALTLDERMTAKPERHAELGLAWPDEAGDSRLVRFLSAEPGAGPVAEIVIGEERFSPDSVFVRSPGEAQTWRARGRIQVPFEATAWLDRTLLSLPTDETQSVQFDGITVSRPAATEGAEPAWRTPWDSTVADEEKERWSEAQVEAARTTLPTFLERLEFEGVRRARADAAKEPAWTASFRTMGATVTLRGHREGEETWFTLDALPVPGASARPAEREGDPFVPDWEAFNARHSGWEYRLPAWKTDALRRMRDAEPTAAPDPAADPMP